MMTPRTNPFTRIARRTLDVLAEIRYAQHRMDEILTDPTGRD